jgi:hypothetical protein
MHFRPCTKSGDLFSRTTIFPNKDRTGGLSGQELAEIPNSPEIKKKTSKTCNNSPTNTLVLTSKIYEKILD